MDPIVSLPGMVVSKQVRSYRRNFVKKSVTGGAGATTIKRVCMVPKGRTLLVRAIIFAKNPTSGELASYEVQATVANKAGTVALVGSVTVIHSAEDDAGWAGTLVANNTDKTIDVQVTPDGTNATVFWGFAEVIEA